ncbi:MAG: MlrC C-terminal domain-containing protein [Thermomicrobium sp.]|nr:MlrC C-terminal domain-containing protein [Thermomicrobium sp.]
MRVGLIEFAYRTNTFAESPGLFAFDLATAPPRSAVAVPGDVELVPLVSSSSAAGGPLPPETFRSFLATIDRACSEAGPLDALLLIGTGTALLDAGSAEVALLRHLRSRFPQALLAAHFEPYAQFPEELLDLTPLVGGPHLWPALDRPRRIERLLGLLLEWQRGRIRPTVECRGLPAVLPLALQRTDLPALAVLPSYLARIESQPGVLLASIFAGFPYADVEFAGARVVVVTEGDRESALRVTDELASLFLGRLPELSTQLPTIEEAIHRAMSDHAHPAIVLDTGDAPEAGGPGEGTAALWAALDLGAHGTLVLGLVDPEAVRLAERAGPAAAVSLELGGKRDHRHGYPIPVEGLVRALASPQVTGPSMLLPGPPLQAGSTAWLELHGRYDSRVHVIVTTNAVPFHDLSLAHELGVEPAGMRNLVVKSCLEFLGTLGSEAARYAILPASTPGITSPDLAFFDYRKIPRPIWPLDPP